MDYKKILRTPRMRETVLDLMRFVPDRFMLKFQYWMKTGRKLNLDDPQRYTEKIQYYKLNYKNPIMHDCVDKFKVREYIKRKNLEDILVKLYAKYDSVDDIDINSLPKSFVIKTTNGGGGLNVIICLDKFKLDAKKIKKQLSSKTIKSKTGGREWAYYGLKPGIIIEELLLNTENPLSYVNDYKIFCYNGNPKYIIVDVDRYTGHKRNFYDIDWNNLCITSDCPLVDKEIEKPKNFSRMLDIARILSEDFPYVRVDLYNCRGRIYFGELTFYPWSGYVQFEPDKADFMFGKDFNISVGE